MTFRRHFLKDPGNAEILSVSSVVIIDNAPPSIQLGSGTGTVLVIGEFERGPLKVPTQVTSSGDMLATFGGLGFGELHEGAVARQSGGSEAWNGNGFIATANKRFNELVIQRVDNSAGSVQFQRLACLTGGLGPFAANNGDTAVFELNGGPSTATATLNVTPATILASGGTFGVPGAYEGLTLILEVDDNDGQTITFTDTDDDLVDINARINGKLASDVASDNGGQLQLDSVREGKNARLRIVGGTALALLGLPTAVVPDVWTITVTADTAITTEVRVSRIVNGLATDFDTAPFLGPVGSTTLKRDKLLSDAVTDPPQLSELGVPGFTFAAGLGDTITATGDNNQILTGITALQGGAELTIVNTTPGVALEVFGTGNVGDSQNFSAVEAANIIDPVTNLSSDVTSPDALLRVCNELTPGTGKLRGSSGALLTALGFDTTTVADAANATNVTIPAGTRVQDATATATLWVTMSDIVTETGGGPWDVKVRPWDDIDTAIASGVGDVTVVVDNLADGFSVTNAAAITRLTAPQLDSRYIDAINESRADTEPSKSVNWSVSARTSAAIRVALRDNARAATAEGLSGRKSVVRPRLGVTRAQARADRAVVADERANFVFPGFATAIQEIRAVGSAGGIGFTDDGVIDVGADTFYAAFRSVILPEESAGIDPAGTNFGPFQVVGLEAAYDPNIEGAFKLEVTDYKIFKREGIIAGKAIRPSAVTFVDDVTSVDAVAFPGRTQANRRAFADFINDTLFDIGTPYSKQIITPALRRESKAQTTGFLEELKGVGDPATSRLDSYSVEDTSSATVPKILRYSVKVRMHPTADAIVFSTTIGDTVVITEES